MVQCVCIQRNNCSDEGVTFDADCERRGKSRTMLARASIQRAAYQVRAQACVLPTFEDEDLVRSIHLCDVPSSQACP